MKKLLHFCKIGGLAPKIIFSIICFSFSVFNHSEVKNWLNRPNVVLISMNMYTVTITLFVPARTSYYQAQVLIHYENSEKTDLRARCIQKSELCSTVEMGNVP